MKRQLLPSQDNLIAILRLYANAELVTVLDAVVLDTVKNAIHRVEVDCPILVQEHGSMISCQNLFGENTADLELFSSANGKGILRLLVGDRRAICPGYFDPIFGRTTQLTASGTDEIIDTRSFLRHYLNCQHWAWLDEEAVGRFVTLALNDPNNFDVWYRKVLDADEEVDAGVIPIQQYMLDVPSTILRDFESKISFWIYYYSDVNMSHPNEMSVGIVDLCPCDEEWLLSYRHRGIAGTILDQP